MHLPHLASRLYGTPLLLARAKLDVILSVLGERVNWPEANLAVSVPQARASLVRASASPAKSREVYPRGLVLCATPSRRAAVPSRHRDRPFRSLPKIGHVRPKSPITMRRKHRSRSSEMGGALGRSAHVAGNSCSGSDRERCRRKKPPGGGCRAWLDAVRLDQREDPGAGRLGASRPLSLRPSRIFNASSEKFTAPASNSTPCRA